MAIYYPIPGLGEIESPNHKQLVKFFDGACAYCSQALTFKAHRDHYWPKSWQHKKAVDHASNIVPACARCNEMKSSQAPWKFEEQWELLGFTLNPKLAVWRALEGDRAEAWDSTFGTAEPSYEQQAEATDSSYRKKNMRSVVRNKRLVYSAGEERYFTLIAWVMWISAIIWWVLLLGGHVEGMGTWGSVAWLGWWPFIWTIGIVTAPKGHKQ